MRGIGRGRGAGEISKINPQRSCGVGKRGLLGETRGRTTALELPCPRCTKLSDSAGQNSCLLGNHHGDVFLLRDAKERWNSSGGGVQAERGLSEPPLPCPPTEPN